MPETDLMSANRSGLLRVEKPRPGLEMESPVVGLKEDPATPDLVPLREGVADDNPESRMALRNEARVRVLLGEPTGPARSLIG